MQSLKSSIPLLCVVKNYQHQSYLFLMDAKVTYELRTSFFRFVLAKPYILRSAAGHTSIVVAIHFLSFSIKLSIFENVVSGRHFQSCHGHQISLRTNVAKCYAVVWTRLTVRFMDKPRKIESVRASVRRLVPLSIQGNHFTDDALFNSMKIPFKWCSVPVVHSPHVHPTSIHVHGQFF